MTSSSSPAAAMSKEDGIMLKLCTYNVFSWRDKKYSNNTERLIEYFKANDFDIISLNEATLPYGSPKSQLSGELRKISQALSMNYVFSPAMSETFGNVLLSKHKIKSCQCVPLRFGYSETRSFAKITIEHPNPAFPDIDFYSTHLDHISEETRLEQQKQMFKMIDSNNNAILQTLMQAKPKSGNESSGGSTASSSLQLLDVSAGQETRPLRPHIILGDFNALTRSDYTESYHNEIAQVRQRSNWETPKFQVTDNMATRGYTDILAKHRPEYKDQLLTTCAYFTRIDYIYASPSLNYTIKEAYIDHKIKASDHFPVVAHLLIHPSGDSSSQSSNTESSPLRSLFIQNLSSDVDEQSVLLATDFFDQSQLSENPMCTFLQLLSASQLTESVKVSIMTAFGIVYSPTKSPLPQFHDPVLFARQNAPLDSILAQNQAIASSASGFPVTTYLDAEKTSQMKSQVQFFASKRAAQSSSNSTSTPYSSFAFTSHAPVHEPVRVSILQQDALNALHSLQTLDFNPALVTEWFPSTPSEVSKTSISASTPEVQSLFLRTNIAQALDPEQNRELKTQMQQSLGPAIGIVSSSASSEALSSTTATKTVSVPLFGGVFVPSVQVFRSSLSTGLGFIPVHTISALAIGRRQPNEQSHIQASRVTYIQQERIRNLLMILRDCSNDGRPIDAVVLPLELSLTNPAMMSTWKQVLEEPDFSSLFRIIVFTSENANLVQQTKQEIAPLK